MIENLQAELCVCQHRVSTLEAQLMAKEQELAQLAENHGELRKKYTKTKKKLSAAVTAQAPSPPIEQPVTPILSPFPRGDEPVWLQR